MKEKGPKKPEEKGSRDRVLPDTKIHFKALIIMTCQCMTDYDRGSIVDQWVKDGLFKER